MKASMFSMLKNKLNLKNSKLYQKFTNFRNKRSYQFSNKKYFRFNPKFIIPLIFSPFSLSKSIAYMEKEKELEIEESHDIKLKDSIRGEYENKIRVFASLEKRFMIFSDIKTPDKLSMSQNQFFHCILPFQYMKTIPFEKMEEKLEKNKLFVDLYKQIDINNDKLISFEEFVIWSLFRSMDFSQLRKLYPSGKITKEQLGEYLMENLRLHSSFKITDKAVIDGRLIKTDHDTIFKALVDNLSNLFKDHTINIEKELMKFMVDLTLLPIIYEVKNFIHIFFIFNLYFNIF
jgi:hypothetical protein